MNHTPKSKADEAALIAELNATFPGIRARPMHDDQRHFADTVGVSVATLTQMPDGLPIFSERHIGEPEYDGTLHEGFSAWCERRGWYVEVYDVFRLDIVPIDPAMAMEWPDWKFRELAPGELPF